VITASIAVEDVLFQSRSGFSGCRDGFDSGGSERFTTCFNPVLGFLGVATPMKPAPRPTTESFNPVLGFLGVATVVQNLADNPTPGFNPVLGFLGVATGGVNTAIRVKKLSQYRKSPPRYVDWDCTPN